jgi:hypothetical protein
MDQVTHNKIVSFIWGIADDVLRDLFKRGKYPDVILLSPVTSKGTTRGRNRGVQNPPPPARRLVAING